MFICHLYCTPLKELSAIVFTKSLLFLKASHGYSGSMFSFALVLVAFLVSPVICQSTVKQSSPDNNHLVELLRQEIFLLGERLDNLRVTTADQLNSIRSAQQESVADLSKDISDLNAKYNNTVRQCLSGTIANACVPCKQTQPATRSADHVITFSPPFHKTPTVTVSITADDDHSGTPIRRTLTVTSVSRTQMTVRLSTWNISRIYYAVIGWMACA